MIPRDGDIVLSPRRRDAAGKLPKPAGLDRRSMGETGGGFEKLLMADGRSQTRAAPAMELATPRAKPLPHHLDTVAAGHGVPAMPPLPDDGQAGTIGDGGSALVEAKPATARKTFAATAAEASPERRAPVAGELTRLAARLLEMAVGAEAADEEAAIAGHGVAAGDVERSSDVPRSAATAEVVWETPADAGGQGTELGRSKERRYENGKGDAGHLGAARDVGRAKPAPAAAPRALEAENAGNDPPVRTAMPAASPVRLKPPALPEASPREQPETVLPGRAREPDAEPFAGGPVPHAKAETIPQERRPSLERGGRERLEEKRAVPGPVRPMQPEQPEAEDRPRRSNAVPSPERAPVAEDVSPRRGRQGGDAPNVSANIRVDAEGPEIMSCVPASGSRDIHTGGAARHDGAARRSELGTAADLSTPAGEAPRDAEEGASDRTAAPEASLPSAAMQLAALLAQALTADKGERAGQRAMTADGDDAAAPPAARPAVDVWDAPEPQLEPAPTDVSGERRAAAHRDASATANQEARADRTRRLTPATVPPSKPIEMADEAATTKRGQPLPVTTIELESHLSPVAPPPPVLQEVDGGASRPPVARPAAPPPDATREAAVKPAQVLKLRIDHDPAGAINATLRLRQNQLAVQLEAGNDDIAARLRDDAGRLTADLQASGYAVDAVTVRGMAQADAAQSSASHAAAGDNRAFGGSQSNASESAPGQSGRQQERMRDEHKASVRDENRSQPGDRADGVYL